MSEWVCVLIFALLLFFWHADSWMLAPVLPFICINNVRLIRYAAFACDAQSRTLAVGLGRRYRRRCRWIDAIKCRKWCLKRFAVHENHLSRLLLLHDGKSPLNLHIGIYITSSLYFNSTFTKHWKDDLSLYISFTYTCMHHGWKLIECCFVVILWKCHRIVSHLNRTELGFGVGYWMGGVVSFAFSRNAINTWLNITHLNAKW